MFKLSSKIGSLNIAIGAVLIFSAFSSSFVSNFIFAAEDSHTIKQTVTGVVDNEDPTIPQNLIATAISASQIDLAWDASTDNIAVTGYKIYRDGLEIDTTTSITYSDTGLDASTLYTYKVSAFDAAGNESAQSDEASATTLSDEVVSPPPSSGGSGSLILKVESFLVTPGLDNAIIQLETNLPTNVKILWGETPDYELGSLSSPVLKKHILLIPDLEPDTVYFFKLEITDNAHRKIILDNQKFKTLAFPLVELPFNVSNLEASSDEENITLKWENPPIEFESIRIIRSDKFFPRDPFDGELVFEGISERFIDKDVLPKVVYYYAVFVKNSKGIYSSGALAHERLKDEEFPLPPDLFAGVIDLPPADVHPLFQKLTLRDFKFIQEGEEARFLENDTVLLKGDRAFKVLIDYEKLPEVLKTIAITLRDPEDSEKFFNFLLRVNQDKSAFEASIASLGREGAFTLNISVLDHKNRGLKRLEGILKSVLPFPPPVLPKLPWEIILFWLFLILLILVLFFRLKPKKLIRVNYEASTN